MEELKNAGKRLRATLDHYFSVCSRMDDLSSREGVLRSVPQRLLHDINTEIAHFASYQPKIQQVETTVRRVRNRLFRITPMAALHPEILAHIFDLVAKPCDLRVIAAEDFDPESPTCSDQSEDRNADPRSGLERRRYRTWQLDNFPTHLDHISRVCSYWRRVAINSPSLWTHIDLIPHKSLHRELLARAEMYIARAHQLPIELHAVDSNPLAYNRAILSQFLSLIRDRVKSLDIHVTHSWRQFHFLVLNGIFSDRTPYPTVLTQLTTSFPMADDDTDEFIDWFIDNNDGFRYLTVMHLHGLLPLWGSAAYHNLVDLRLTSPTDERWTHIPEENIRNILEASPGLHILYFSLQITGQPRDDESAIPVSLNNLEVLNISTYRCNEDPVLRPGDILRLLAPGFKPLRLSIWHSPKDGDFDDHGFSLEELIGFFKRSNVTKFSAKYACPQLDKLLCYAPNLEDLAFESCMFGWQGTNLFRRGSPVKSSLNSLVLYHCSPSLDQIELLLQEHPAEQLLLCRCDWDYIEDSSGVRSPVRQVSELLERYPTSKLIIQPSNPTVHWDMID
ncbi:hypothetical protein OPQ81_005138 [Rhizoctonia solani]|nr:hypothetical protein OPQ81_005138 [Rhizoctonia solani]